MDAGTAVICDRYAFSGIAFSAAKGLSYEWCRSPEIRLPAPDLTVFLDITPEKAKERGGYGEERYEKEELQREVRRMFDRISKEMLEDGGRWVTLDAGKERVAVSEEVWAHVDPLTAGFESPPQRLWNDRIL